MTFFLQKNLWPIELALENELKFLMGHTSNRMVEMKWFAILLIN